jgi:hypothetical protein
MERRDNENRHPHYGSKVSLGIRITTTLCGLILLVWSFYVPPKGVIDKSVLFAFGEIAVFVASLMWIDYYYIFHPKKRNTRHK